MDMIPLELEEEAEKRKLQIDISRYGTPNNTDKRDMIAVKSVEQDTVYRATGSIENGVFYVHLVESLPYHGHTFYCAGGCH